MLKLSCQGRCGIQRIQVPTLSHQHSTHAYQAELDVLGGRLEGSDFHPGGFGFPSWVAYIDLHDCSTAASVGV